MQPAGYEVCKQAELTVECYSQRRNPNPPASSNYPDRFVAYPSSNRAYTRALRLESAEGNWRDVINEMLPYTSRHVATVCRIPLG
ncbi:MAG: hypothetical protein ACXWUD_07945 [Methylosarcina sp.]